MTPGRAKACTVLVLLCAVAAVLLGGWTSVAAAILLANVAAIGVALWRGRSALAPIQKPAPVPKGVLWC